MYQGSCLCGTIKFQIKGAISDIVKCHCSLCRKAQGSAFATNGNVNTNEFSFISGEDNLSHYKASENQTKSFCKTCGSPIMSKNSLYPDKLRIRLGTIETNINERPTAHIFVASKANWDEINDSIPQFDKYVQR